MKINVNVLQKQQNERGFTLIESIISLLIVMIIFTIIPLMIKAFNYIDRSLSTEETYEWNTFLMQLRNEMRNSEEVSTAMDKLTLDINSEIVTYEQYGNLLRRRVNDTGHEVVLQKVKKASFSIEKNEMILTVRFTNNDQQIAEFSFLNSNNENTMGSIVGH